jgi:hypothetical protein
MRTVPEAGINDAGYNIEMPGPMGEVRVSGEAAALA